MISATALPNRQAVPDISVREDGDAVRSALYGLLSHLFFAPPGAALLQQVAQSREVIAGSDSLARTWHALVDAAQQADPGMLRGEFDGLFVSTGRPTVSLYASSYMQGQRKGHLLAELREDLIRLGFRRGNDASEYEDHLSAICDVMRGLIVDEDDAEASFAAQQRFFQCYLSPWHAALCAALEEAEQALFYRDVSRFVTAFFANESVYFELA